MATVNETHTFSPRPPHLPGKKLSGRASLLESMAKIFADGLPTEDPFQRYGYDNIAHARQASAAFEAAYTEAGYKCDRTCWHDLHKHYGIYMSKCHPMKPRDYAAAYLYSRMLDGTEPVIPPVAAYEPTDPPLLNPYPFPYADDNSRREVIWDVRSMSRDTWWADNITLSPEKVLKPRLTVARRGDPLWTPANASAAARPGAHVAIKGYLSAHCRHGAFLDFFHTGEILVGAAGRRRPHGTRGCGASPCRWRARYTHCMHASIRVTGSGC